MIAFRETMSICILWSLLVEPHMADEALGHLVYYNEIYKGAKKVWYEYVKECGNKMLAYMADYTVSDNFLDILKEELDLSKKFMKYSIKVTTYHVSNAKTVIKKASGGVAIEHLAIIKDQFHFANIWKFQLHGMLTMNITFEHLHLTSSSETCQLGSIKVKNLQNKAQYFLFCGQNSKFCLYPPFTFFQIFVAYHSYYYLNIYFFYVIMDKHIILNSPLNTEHIPSDVVSMLLIQTENILLSLMITVLKRDYIVFDMDQDLIPKYVVFDGP